MSGVITIAAPLYAIILTGFLAGRRGLMSEANAGALNRFVFLFAMPAAVFRFAATNPPPSGETAFYALTYLACALSVMAGAYFVGRKLLSLTKREAGVHAFGSTLGNAVFLGIPIALSVPGWGGPFLILILMEGIFIMSVGAILMTAPEDGAKRSFTEQALGSAQRVSRNPIAMGMIAGFILSALGASLPEPVERFALFLGGAAGPAALFSLGVVLAQKRDAPAAGGLQSVLAITALKLCLLPLLVIGAMHLIGASWAQIGAAALFTSVPMGVGVYVQAAHYGIYQRRIALALTATTILSMLTVSTVLLIFAPSG